MSRPRVEILYFEGCPNHEAARGLVERAAAELHLDPEIELVQVHNPQAAEQFQFLGSPTVRVDGRDVEPGADARDDFVFACRVYRSEGELSGQPEIAWVREALSEAAA